LSRGSLLHLPYLDLAITALYRNIKSLFKYVDRNILVKVISRNSTFEEAGGLKGKGEYLEEWSRQRR